MVETLRWKRSRVELLDQTLMPERVVYRPLRTEREVTDAIRRMLVRGAPAIGVTAAFGMLYVFVVIEHGRRRLAHGNVTANPTAEWMLQQLREAVGEGEGHRYLIHDRDSIYAPHLAESIKALRVQPE